MDAFELSSANIFQTYAKDSKNGGPESTASAGAGLLGSLGGRKEEFFGGNVILRAGN